MMRVCYGARSSRHILRILRFTLYTLFTVMLLGCGSDSDMEELQEYIAEVKNRSPQPLEPLPEPKIFQTFTYVANDRRGPFTPSDDTDEQPMADPTSTVFPRKDRRKEELESFPLDALNMVGTLRQNSEIWALIQAADGTVHRVKAGNYMGKNHGKILSIAEDKIDIIEIVSNGMGGWLERAANLVLSGE